MIRSAKIILYSAFAMVSCALADDAPDYRYPETFNNIESRNNNPGHKPAPLLTDEAFYGKWDAAESVWITPGLFDYARHPGLEPVAAAVKRGDYPAAGEALLAYYRDRDSIDVPELPEANDRSKLRAELIMDQVYMQEAPLLQFEVQTKPAEYVLDVSGAVQAGNGRFMLTSRQKGAGTAIFNSREAAAHRPALRLVVDGEEQVLDPVADTYLQYGSGPKGKETSLLVSGARPGVAIDENTTKALLRFDLSPLKIEAIDKAELVLYGNTDADSGSMSLLLGPDMDSPLEAANDRHRGQTRFAHRLVLSLVRGKTGRPHRRPTHH